MGEREKSAHNLIKRIMVSKFRPPFNILKSNIFKKLVNFNTKFLLPDKKKDY
jgi:hypothetical protein